MLNIDFLLLIVSTLVQQYEVTTWEMVYVTVSKLFSSKCREVVGQMLGQNWTAKCMWGINLLLQTTLSHETITIWYIILNFDSIFLQNLSRKVDKETIFEAISYDKNYKNAQSDLHPGYRKFPGGDNHVGGVCVVGKGREDGSNDWTVECAVLY